jgi:hypothetical protein
VAIIDGAAAVQSAGRASMKDMQASLEKLLTDAADAALIRDLATDSRKRELFTRLADHLAMLAAVVEREIATQAAETK